MEQLGIEWVQLLTQVFNFVVMAVLLTRFLYKPILKMLKERQEKIAEGIEYSQKMKGEAEKIESKRAVVLQKAREEAAGIIEESKKAGKSVEAGIIATAHEEARGIVEKGRADIEMERADMEKKLKDELIETAGVIAMKVLEATLTNSQQKGIIDKKIRAVAKQLS